MLVSVTGRGPARLLPKQICRYYRIESTPGAFVRATAPYSTIDSSLSSSCNLKNLNVVVKPSLLYRALATRAAAKPKAHTGRAATKKSTKKAGRKAKKGSSQKKPKSKAKAKPKRSPKKQLTEEEKKKSQLKELKKTALKRPKQLPQTVLTIVNAEISKERGGLAMSEALAKVKNLTPEEQEHYNRAALENKAKNETEYKAWILSHTPDEIRKANNARRRLATMGVKGYRNKLTDDRAPKQPATAHGLFMRDRYSTGEMAGIKFGDAAKMIYREYQNLPQTEKEKYQRAHEQEKAQYIREYQRVYGRPSKAQGVAAAAA